MVPDRQVVETAGYGVQLLPWVVGRHPHPSPAADRLPHVRFPTILVQELHSEREGTETFSFFRHEPTTFGYTGQLS